ncbi:MAG: FKBP-type peptidyl-prolyl cis-trans isomerase [Alistipes sp.]|nr:FKBP-type peptidyl-prolyl cis-trans isomerase [Alistipes sp.]MDE6861242.1 FKBP-type peptidyl-prolyl cis-trans isomerase [Alistipes sp.]MDE7130141.1 FKBP-type peptidyl-prolyl cis-trans isomerase [Alistipes sp.]
MKRLLSIAVAALFAAMSACGGGADGRPSMNDDTDTMSYVLGMNIAYNLMEMDSTINVDMVCMAIRDAYAHEERLSADEARTSFLRFMNYDNYERIQRYEEQFMNDLRAADRKFVRTTSGLTYKIDELGNPKESVRNNRDTVMIRYRAATADGEVFDSSYERGDTLRIAVGDLTKGLQEAVKIIGKGGRIEAWLPSRIGFGADGCDSLDVKPNSILFYDMELIDVERRTR